MTGNRKSKRVYWEIMSQLEEAGEEDLCSLLNQVMGAQPFFGSGRDLAEYLDAIAGLEEQGEICVREYELEGGRTLQGDVTPPGMLERRAAFHFDAVQRIWTWEGARRQVVELPED